MRDILTPLFRRRRLLILTFCGVFLGAIAAAFLLSSQYEASMEILVNRDRMDPVVTAEQFSQTTPVATCPDGRRYQFRSRVAPERGLAPEGCARQQASGQRDGLDLGEADAEEGTKRTTFPKP